jgi:hypothetical protein
LIAIGYATAPEMRTDRRMGEVAVAVTTFRRPETRVAKSERIRPSWEIAAFATFAEPTPGNSNLPSASTVRTAHNRGSCSHARMNR